MVISVLMLTVPKLTKTGLKRILESAVIRIVCNDQTLSVLAETLLSTSSFHDLCITDILCGLLLNNLVWHHKRESGVPLNAVKNLPLDQYLVYLKEHPEELQSHPPEQEETLFTNKEVLNELKHYAEYANAIYGVSL